MKPVTQKHWRLRNPDPVATRELSTATGLSLPLSMILVGRGICDPASASRFVSPELSGISDPFLLKGMTEAVARILQARRAGETVCIHGDYDVDGVTAVALLASFFRAVGLKVCYLIPKRLHDGYGMSREGVDEAIKLGAKLLITVDCGITSLEEARYCTEHGIDLIITDHHTPGKIVPAAVAVINPLQPDCPSPFKQLAGVGIAFKLAVAVRSGMREAGLFAASTEPNLRQYLDLVALGTVADLVPLVGENRVIVSFGLLELTKSQRPGIDALKRVAAVEGSVSSGDVGFRLAPRLNAAGRLDDALRGVELLLTTDLDVAKELAAELDAANRERQQLEKEMLADARQRLDNDISGSERTTIVLADKNWHPGVIGIVASRLVDLYYRPTILFALQNGSGRGSGRSVAGFHLYEALSACAPLLSKFGGHRQAAGLELAVEQLADFSVRFEEYAAANLCRDDMLPEIMIDALLRPEEITPELLEARKTLMPFGMGNNEPVFMLESVEIVRHDILKDQHLKLRIRAGNRLFDAIGFGMAARLPESNLVDLAFVAENNLWKGQERLQLRLKDIRESGKTDGT